MKKWIKAFRLRTLPLSLACIGMGSFLAAAFHEFRWEVLVLSLLTTVFLQILSNLSNDYGDYVNGADHTERSGPKRSVQSGEITPADMKKMILLFGVLSLVSGISLLALSLDVNVTFFLFLGLGLLSIYAAIKYTMGNNPYGYAGLGDIAVLIFFGWIGVCGTFFLHAGYFDPSILLPATSCGLLAVGVLNINNIRDIESDRQAGKRSIPVRIGRANAVRYHITILIVSTLLAMIFVLRYDFSVFKWLFMLTIPLLVINAQAVIQKKEASALDPYLRQLALTTLLFVLLFGGGLLLG